MKEVLNALSLEKAWKHLKWIETNAPSRIAGTPDQERAAEYFVGTLDGYGLDTRMDSFTAYRSVPTRGAFDILSPVAKSFPCEPCGHIVSTPDEGLEVDLLYLGSGSEEDYANKDVRGAAVLTEISSGPSRPVKAWIAAKHGAAVIVFVNWGLPEFGTIPHGGIKCVWGNPTRETMTEIPQIAALGISRAAGDEVIAVLRERPVRARIVAQATRDWGPLKQPMAHLKAPSNPNGDFLVVGGHHDSWKPGMTDNASGNVLKLELARVFALHREKLTRDIVFGFWNGHEIGDYEGSTWFADRYWDELDAAAVAYFNIDSVGFANSSTYIGDSTPELEDFHRRIEREILGIETGHRHLTRGNEHPFFGLGLPALEGRYHFSKEQIEEWGGARGSWWWHSSADTLDKLDKDLYGNTARIFAGYVWEMCTATHLPMDFFTTAARIKDAVTTMQEVAGESFELDLPIDQFADAAIRLHGATNSDKDDGAVFRLNQAKKRLSRLLLPAFETAGGRYTQDRYGLEALQSAIPAVHSLHLLSQTPADAELSHLLHTELLRERNRLSDALRRATDEILEAVA